MFVVDVFRHRLYNVAPGVRNREAREQDFLTAADYTLAENGHFRYKYSPNSFLLRLKYSATFSDSFLSVIRMLKQFSGPRYNTL